MFLKNKVSGVEGVFVKEFKNYYGESIMVRTKDNREYYAPKHEWEYISENNNLHNRLNK